MLKIRTIALVFILASSGPTAYGQLGQLSKWLNLGKKDELADDKIVAGLKEALQVGTENAVQSTGQQDGFFKNEIIKILMPSKLRTLEKGLRAVGYDSEIDEFILSMNRAAERAAPAAKEIFLDSILEMSFDDARRILTGGETSATEYFKAKTSDKLTAAFRPIVAKATEEVGVTEQYKKLTGVYRAIPFAQSQSLDIDDYVVGKALDGLFHMVGEEERKIRKNPAARVTDLLKLVFGKT